MSERRTADATNTAQWMTVINREQVVEALPWKDEESARNYFDPAQSQWSESWLLRVVVGPRNMPGFTHPRPETARPCACGRPPEKCPCFANGFEHGVAYEDPEAHLAGCAWAADDYAPGADSSSEDQDEERAAKWLDAHSLDRRNDLVHYEALARLLAEVRAEEREACAEIAEDHVLHLGESHDPRDEAAFTVGANIATTIRRRTRTNAARPAKGERT